MKLARDSRIIQWAYLMHKDYEIPERTNVCALFWRVFLLSPLRLVVVAMMFLVMWPIPVCEWLQKKGYTDFLYWEIRLPAIRRPTGASNLAWQRLKDWKSGVCTIVEIK